MMEIKIYKNLLQKLRKCLEIKFFVVSLQYQVKQNENLQNKI